MQHLAALAHAGYPIIPRRVPGPKATAHPFWWPVPKISGGDSTRVDEPVRWIGLPREVE